MDRIVSATEARVHFGELLDAVEHGQTVIVQRGGEPKAAVVPVAELERVRASSREKWVHAQAMLAEYHEKLIAEGAVERLRGFDVEEAIRFGRDDRDERLHG